MIKHLTEFSKTYADCWKILKESMFPQPTETDELIIDTKDNMVRYICSIVYKNYDYLVFDHTCLDKSVFTRSFITEILDYCFTKKDVIRAFVKSDNVKSLKFMRQIGFSNDGCYRKYFKDGTDFVIFSLFKEEWERNRFNVRVNAIHNKIN